MLAFFIFLSFILNNQDQKKLFTMNVVSHWYKNLSLRRRFVYSFNLVLFITLAGIAVPALLNRVNNQFRDANNLLFPNLEELCVVLSLADEENWNDFKEIVYNKRLYNTGYVSLVSTDGTLLIDPYNEGSNISQLGYFEQFRQATRGRIAHRDPRAEAGRQRKHIFYVYSPTLKNYLTFTIDHKELIGDPLKNTTLILVFALIFSSLIFTVTIIRIARSISKPLLKLQTDFDQIGRGMLPNVTIKHKYNDELGYVINSVINMIDGLRKKSAFANEIARNNFDHPFKPLSNDDELGNSLVNMRDSLLKASREEAERKKEDEKRNWSTVGLAKFSDILRQKNDNLKEFSYEIIKNIVKYTQANQGGILILNEDNADDKYLELTGCYAYDRRKYKEKRVDIGEGLVGACFLEQKTTFITNLPQDYIKITSGLGDNNPECLLLVPLTLNEKTLGVIELASFEPFEDFQVEFLEKLGESIASAISSARINQQTTMLLAQSRLQTEEMKAQEEEMRQNLEELSATQEEATRKSEEMEVMLNEYKAREATLLQKIEELERQGGKAED